MRNLCAITLSYSLEHGIPLVPVVYRLSWTSNLCVDLGSLGGSNRNAMHSVSLRAPCRSGIGLSIAALVQPVSQPDKRGPAATKRWSIAASIFSILPVSQLLLSS